MRPEVDEAYAKLQHEFERLKYENQRLRFSSQTQESADVLLLEISDLQSQIGAQHREQQLPQTTTTPLRMWNRTLVGVVKEAIAGALANWRDSMRTSKMSAIAAAAFEANAVLTAENNALAAAHTALTTENAALKESLRSETEQRRSTRMTTDHSYTSPKHQALTAKNDASREHVFNAEERSVECMVV